MLKSVLNKLGLSDKDAAVYLASLELGPQPASIIAKRLGIKRTSAYLLLKNLSQQGFLSQYIQKNVRYFSAIEPECLIRLLEKRRIELKEHQSQLEKFLAEQDETEESYDLTPSVRFFEGIAGIEHVMEDTLTTKGSIFCYSNFDRWFEHEALTKYSFEYERRRVKEKKIPLRLIMPESKKTRSYMEEEYTKSKNKDLTKFRWLPKGSPIITNEINIYDDKIAICSLGPNEYHGILIFSREIANSQRAIFEIVWGSGDAGRHV